MLNKIICAFLTKANINTVELSTDNLLVIGGMRSGKSYQIHDLIKRLLKKNKTVFLFAPTPPDAHPSFREEDLIDLIRAFVKSTNLEERKLIALRYINVTEKNYLILEHENLTKATYWNEDCLTGYELPKRLYQKHYDAVIIDNINLLTEQSSQFLFEIIRNRPNTKFIVSVQFWINKLETERDSFKHALINTGKETISKRIAEFANVDLRELKKYQSKDIACQFVQINLEKNRLIGLHPFFSSEEALPKLLSSHSLTTENLIFQSSINT